MIHFDSIYDANLYNANLSIERVTNKSPPEDQRFLKKRKKLTNRKSLDQNEIKTSIISKSANEFRLMLQEITTLDLETNIGTTKFCTPYYKYQGIMISSKVLFS